MLKSFLKDVEGNKFTNEKEQLLDREKQPLPTHCQTQSLVFVGL
jgi:hypothetical protein